MTRLNAGLWVGIVVAISFANVRADDVPPLGVPNAAPLAVGSSLTAFASTDDGGQAWNSADHVGKKVLVLYFYPGDFTGGCTRQAQAYRDALVKIQDLGAEVVGVSGDQASTHQLFKTTYELKHSLLADTEGKLAALFGIPVKAGGSLRATGPDRKPLRDAEGKRIDIDRPVTISRWTVVVAPDGRIASLRSVSTPLTDAEDVQKIVASLKQ